MPDGLRLALTTLTVLPVGGPAALHRRTAGRAMTLAPAVGLLLAALAGVGLLAGGLLGAALAVALLALLTRGLHLDGLADTADGLASYAGPQRAREIMKAPDVGALGVAAVLLVVLVQVAALAACPRPWLALVVATVSGRTAVTLACTPGVPAVCAQGLGALVAGTVARPVALSVAALAVLLGAAAGLPAGPSGVGRAALAVVLALLAARLLRDHCVRRLGGVGGDVLGALVEVGTTVAMVVQGAHG